MTDVPMATKRELLFHLAEDAFDVMNWARREGMNKTRQLEQVVEAFEKTLSDSAAILVTKDGTCDR
jgi:hypothetical protein